MPKKIFGEEIFLPPYRGRLKVGCRSPHFLQAISDCRRLLNSPGTEMLLNSRNRVGVLKLKVDGEKAKDVVIKEFRTVGVDKWKTLFSPSKACKAWKGAWILLENNIGTPSPLAYLERRERKLIQENYFLTERIFPVREIRYLFRELTASRMEALLKSLASYLVSCHQKGILHRDLSDGNILVEEDEKGDYRFFLLDTNHVHIRKRLGSFKRVKNLIRLGIPSSFQSYFLEKYFGATTFPRYLKFWYKFNKGLYTGFVQFKKKLSLRKLARRMRIQ